MTNTTRIHYVTAGLALTGTILAVGSTLTGIPSLPGWAVSSWPIVYGVAITFDRVARILWPDVVPPPQTSVLSITPSDPVTLSSDTLHETPDRLRIGVNDPHALANAVIEAQAGIQKP